MKLDVISPHQDDAALSLALALSEFTRCGVTVRIINCFTVTRFTPFYDNEKGNRRVRDDEDKKFAAECGGGIEHVNLGRKDAPLRTGRGLRAIPIDEAYTSQNAREIDELQRDISFQVPTSAVLLLPLAAGVHVDHCVVRDAAVPLCADRLFAVYEDLPYAARLSDDEVQKKIMELEARFGTGLIPVLVGRESSLPFKKRCLRCYPSQVGERTITQILDYSHRYGGAERLWMTRSCYDELTHTGARLVPQSFAPSPINATGTTWSLHEQQLLNHTEDAHNGEGDKEENSRTEGHAGGTEPERYLY